MSIRMLLGLIVLFVYYFEKIFLVWNENRVIFRVFLVWVSFMLFVIFE